MFITVRHIADAKLRDVNSIHNEGELKDFVKTEMKNNNLIRVTDIELEDNTKEPLETAFELTNSIVSPWFKNKNINVTEEARKGCRSTSVGDVIQMNGKSWIVASIGFIEL